MTSKSLTVIQVSHHDRAATARFYADIFGWEIHHEPTHTWFAAPASAPLAGQVPLTPFIVLVEPRLQSQRLAAPIPQPRPPAA